MMVVSLNIDSFSSALWVHSSAQHRALQLTVVSRSLAETLKADSTTTVLNKTEETKEKYCAYLLQDQLRIVTHASHRSSNTASSMY